MAVPSKSRTLFVGNIPYDATEAELTDIFSRAGAVASFRLVFDRDTKQPKGYGFCDYVDAESAVNAIKSLSDAEYNGRRLRMDLTDGVMGKGLGKPGSVPMLPPSSGGSAPLPATSALPSSLPPTSGPPIAIAPGMVPIRPPAPGTNLPDTGPDPVLTQKLTAEAIQESVHTEIAQAVAAMPKAQMQICLGVMQRLAKEAPEATRAMLQEHPQLSYALLHAQLILGLTVDPILPPDEDEVQQLRAKAARRHVPPGYAPVIPAPPPAVMPQTAMPAMAPGLLPVGTLPGGLVMGSMPTAAPVPSFLPAGAGLTGKAAPPMPAGPIPSMS